MAELTAPQKLALRAEIGQRFSETRRPFPLTKAQLDAAITATDQWIDSNATSYNNALPTAAKNNLSASDKAELFSLVARVRYGG